MVRAQQAAAPAELGHKCKSRRIGRVRGAHGAPTRGVSRWRVAARRFGGRVGRQWPTSHRLEVGRCGAAVDHGARSATDLSHHAPTAHANPVLISALVAVPAPSRRGGAPLAKRPMCAIDSVFSSDLRDEALASALKHGSARSWRSRRRRPRERRLCRARRAPTSPSIALPSARSSSHGGCQHRNDSGNGIEPP